MSRSNPPGTFDIGTRIRVKPGVSAPEFPDVSCAGWSGSVTERVGTKAAPKYVIAWDEATLARLPSSYRERCERQGLLFEMSCFAADDLEPIEEP